MTTLKQMFDLIPPEALAKHELWLYSNLGDFVFIIPEKEKYPKHTENQADLFFEDGFPYGKNVIMLKEIPPSLQEKYQTLRKNEVDPLSQYNECYSTGFYYLPLNETKDFYLIKSHTSIKNLAIASSLFCYIPPHEKKFFEILHTQEENGLSNFHYVFYLDKFAQLSLLLEHELSAESKSIINLHFYLEDESQVEFFDFHYSGKLTRLTSYVDIAGYQSSYRHYGLFFGHQDHHSDATSLIRHLQSKSHSEQIYVSLLNHNSSSAFTGNIYVKEGLKEIKAKQLLRSFLLSEFAQSFSRPQLEIHSDEVECSHGASIGQLEKEALFYLKSRSISENLATKLLLESHIEEIFCKLPDTLKNTAKNRIQYYLTEIAHG